MVVHIGFTTEWVMVLSLTINFGEWKVEITCSAPAVLAPVAAGALAPRERKLKDFDADLQDEF